MEHVQRVDSSLTLLFLCLRSFFDVDDADELEEDDLEDERVRFECFLDLFDFDEVFSWTGLAFLVDGFGGGD